MMDRYGKKLYNSNQLLNLRIIQQVLTIMLLVFNCVQFTMMEP